MSKKLKETIILFIAILVLTGIVVAILNIENIMILTTKSMVIDSKEDYSLDDLKNGDSITLNGTPNNLFESEFEDNNKPVVAFALKEYIFDFIVITPEENKNAASFNCIDTTDSEKDMLAKFITQFNEPINIDKFLSESETVLNEESKNTLLQNTMGQFGDATRLLDCTSIRKRTNLEIYFLLVTEFIFLSGGVFFFFRKRLLYFIDELKEEIEEELE